MVTKFSQPHMLCCHCLPSGSLPVLGYLGHFHRAISQLNWYKIICIGDLACTLSQMKLSLFSCLSMSVLTPNSGGNMPKRKYLWCFHAMSTRENISCVYLIADTSGASFTCTIILRLCHGWIITSHILYRRHYLNQCWIILNKDIKWYSYLCS